MATSDPRAEARTQYEACLLAKKEIEDFMATPGYARLEGFLRDQLTSRRETDFNNLMQSVEQILKSNFARGEIAGLQIALIAPTLMLEDTEHHMKVAREEMGNDDTDHEAGRSGDAPSGIGPEAE